MKFAVRAIGVVLMLIAACLGLVVSSTAEDKPFVLGLLLSGPNNDQGWNEAHFLAGRYVQNTLPLTKMIYLDRLNPSDRPGVSLPRIVDDFALMGARLIIADSPEMQEGIREAAQLHPEVFFVDVGGDDVLTGKAPQNLSNLMGRMDYGEMMAGFAAALTSKTGKIAYLGALANDETRRYAVSAYLGARYGWQEVLHKDLKDLHFKVDWIGYWHQLPGVTEDPARMAGDFFDSGYDVVISGLESKEAVTVAQEKRKAGRDVHAIAYNDKAACASTQDACLGVPYFNWGPAYLQLMEPALSGTWKQEWLWLEPDWKNINDPETSVVGFLAGAGLQPDAKAALDRFIQDLGSGEVALFRGPLHYQDGSLFLKEGEVATDQQLWTMPQLLQGMEGASESKTVSLPERDSGGD